MLGNGKVTVWILLRKFIPERFLAVAESIGQGTLVWVTGYRQCLVFRLLNTFSNGISTLALWSHKDFKSLFFFLILILYGPRLEPCFLLICIRLAKKFFLVFPYDLKEITPLNCFVLVPSETKQDPVGLRGTGAFLFSLHDLHWVPNGRFKQLLIREGRGYKDRRGTAKKQ